MIVQNPVIHAAQLAAIHAAAMPAEGAWSEDSFSSLCSQPGVFAAIHPDAFLLARIAADECEILTFAVAPEHQRQGIGERLLAVVVEETVKRGGKTLFLDVAETNRAARSLYQKAGFSEAGRREAYYGGKTAALLLRLAIQP